MPSDSFVYVIAPENHGPAKIGVADNPKARLASLQTGSPVKLRLIDAIPLPSRRGAHQIESLMHSIYEGCRLHGEWFDTNPEDCARFIRRNAPTMFLCWFAEAA